MKKLTYYCAIQAGAYTFDTTKFDPQTVAVISCLVTWEFGGRQIERDLQKSMIFDQNPCTTTHRFDAKLIVLKTCIFENPSQKQYRFTNEFTRKNRK